jgi:micrococcal nuclease
VRLEGSQNRDPVEVLHVIDGNTIEVSLEGETTEVRLIGIDAPETGETFAAEATAALEGMIEGQGVSLQYDVERTDQYGRTLAYVWLYDGEVYWMANEALLLRGLATTYTVPPNVAYVEQFTRAQDSAQAEGSGIWAAGGASPPTIVLIHADAAGSDNDNLNDEYLVFRVLVSGSLLGYAVEDATGHRYEFPDRVLMKDQTLTLHTGSGTDTQTDLYWGSAGAIWNNDGDLMKVLDPQGYIVLSRSH